jgi:hypothetical protein
MTLYRIDCAALGCGFYCGTDSHLEARRVATHHFNLNSDLRGPDQRPVHVPRITAKATTTVHHGRQVLLEDAAGVPA